MQDSNKSSDYGITTSLSKRKRKDDDDDDDDDDDYGGDDDDNDKFKSRERDIGKWKKDETNL
jgi:hypothetical protein